MPPILEFDSNLPSYRLADYHVLLDMPVPSAGNGAPREVLTACPQGLEDHVRLLLLCKQPGRHEDETTLITDIARAGFVVLTVDRVQPTGHAHQSTAFLVYVCHVRENAPQLWELTAQ